MRFLHTLLIIAFGIFIGISLSFFYFSKFHQQWVLENRVFSKAIELDSIITLLKAKGHSDEGIFCVAKFFSENLSAQISTDIEALANQDSDFTGLKASMLDTATEKLENYHTPEVQELISQCKKQNSEGSI
ncbi:hypothetical protein [Thalassotalea litorea]|uniref:hypothetical protein n=1 Tax=Thalassotalea litorea TaxID=2020715 RepID=UPI003734DCC6